jgi:hypothetical protein
MTTLEAAGSLSGVLFGIIILWAVFGVATLGSMGINMDKYWRTDGQKRTRCNWVLGPAFWAITMLQICYDHLADWVNEREA